MLHRFLTGGVAVLLSASLLAADAFAHGGQFRGPFGGVPPGMREPFDPPPAPPPTSGGPVTPGQPGSPLPGGPSLPPSPVTPPQGSTPNVPPGSGRGRSAGLSFEDWSFWLAYNDDPIKDLKAHIYASVGSGHVLDPVGRPEAGLRTDATHRVRAQVGRMVLPTLLKVIQDGDKNDGDIESAAYIALAKVAREPVHVEAILRRLQRNVQKRPIVVESCALALGLLRRTDAAEQLPAADLDRVRKVLFEVIDNEEHLLRTRAFAAYALGLLGDQPTGSNGTDAAAAAQETTSALLARVDRQGADRDVPVALMIAVGLQPAESLLPAPAESLRSLAIKGRAGKIRIPDVVQAHAIQALGRIGSARDVGVMARLFDGPGINLLVQRSAAIGLGTLATRLSASERADLVEGMIKSLKTSRHLSDRSTRNFAMIAIADHIVADAEAERSTVLTESDAGDWLVSQAEKGSPAQRTYGALALSLAARAIGEEADDEVQGRFRHEAVVTLRQGLFSKKLSRRDRGCFAVCLGIVRDARSVPALAELVADRRLAPDLRGHAALGIGLTGFANPTVRQGLRTAMRDASSEEMRVLCATSLGLVSDREAVPVLLEELDRARSQAAKGQIVVALASIGDERAVKPLVDLVTNRKEQNLTRALACAGLGLVGDLEPVPSLSRLSLDVNYRAQTESLKEALSIL